MVRGTAVVSTGTSDSPNIVWIYCDELRADALSPYGHPTLNLHTPNIQRIADQGVTFERHYCNSPVCVASRTSILTGLLPEQTGVYNNDAALPAFTLPTSLTTFPELLAQNGYVTANFGKLHVPPEMAPNVFQHHDRTGADTTFYGDHESELIGVIRSPNGTIHAGEYPDSYRYPPEAVVDNGLRWMERQTDPFLVRFSFNQPHTPVLVPHSYAGLYTDQPLDVPRTLPAGLSAFEKRVADIQQVLEMDPADLGRARRHYYALVAWVDSQVGRILDFIQRSGRANDTIVVFTSDHGNPLGETGGFEKLIYHHSVHRVPMLISYPARIPEGVRRSDICESVDLGRTLLELSGVEAPHEMGGRNLMTDPAPAVVYSSIGFGQESSRFAPLRGFGTWYGDRGWPRRSCIRTDRYRLDKNTLLGGEVPDAADTDIFLCDTESDPDEFTNYAHDSHYRPIVEQLTSEIDTRTRRS